MWPPTGWRHFWFTAHMAALSLKEVGLSVFTPAGLAVGYCAQAPGNHFVSCMGGGAGREQGRASTKRSECGQMVSPQSGSFFSEASHPLGREARQEESVGSWGRTGLFAELHRSLKSLLWKMGH